METDIINLRHHIHQNPELSNLEFGTSQYIKDFITKLSPDAEVEISKTGLAFTFDSKKEGPTSVFRAELDALPIIETSGAEFASKNGNAHSCGHDGHMAILCSFAKKVAAKRPEKGKCVVLFQPAEEVEQGGRDVAESNEFAKIKPDYMFALHNVPGYAEGNIIHTNDCFAVASEGMTITLTGKTSHAAEPQNGISPKTAISKIIAEVNKLMSPEGKKIFSNNTLATMVFIKMGEPTFGTSPGFAEIMITLRATKDADMQLLRSKIEDFSKTIAGEEKLSCNITYCEKFPACVNNIECSKLIENAADKLNYSKTKMKKPFNWSEDFAYYTTKCKAAMFGLGSGLNQPQLHNSNFNFPDQIIENGANMFFEIYEQLNRNNKN